MPALRLSTRRRVARLPVATRALALALAAWGCDRPQSPARAESTAVVPRTDSTATAAPAQVTWDRTQLGTALLVATDDPATALVVSPDTVPVDSLGGARATLVGHGGQTLSATLAARTEQHGENACAGLPAWRLAVTGTPAPWTTGLVGGRVAPIAMDSLEALSRADSSRLVAEASRLASAVPDDGAGRFQGLPFAVRALWRFRAAGVEIFAATLIRNVNQEARPLEERTLLVAERDTAANAPWVTGYTERSSGDEETVQSRDVLAAAHVGSDAQPLLVLARDFGDEAAYSLLERVGPAQWRLRWTSPRTRC